MRISTKSFFLAGMMLFLKALVFAGECQECVKRCENQGWPTGDRGSCTNQCTRLYGDNGYCS
jgi:hypothetical protein